MPNITLRNFEIDIKDIQHLSIVSNSEYVEGLKGRICAIKRLPQSDIRDKHISKLEAEISNLKNHVRNNRLLAHVVRPDGTIRAYYSKEYSSYDIICNLKLSIEQLILKQK